MQYAEDDGPIKIHDVWKEPISETLQLIEWIASKEVCGFNLAFDWFHLYKCYSTFILAPDYQVLPEDCIDEIAELENRARGSRLCLKPKAACDLMLHARKGKYQSLMERSDIRIKRIPTRLAEPLRVELEKCIELDDIYFARRKDKHAPRWSIRDVHFPDGDINPDFKDIVLKFNASGALKVLAQHALGVEEDLILKFTDIDPDPLWRPKDLGYAPYAMATGKSGKWNWAWPEVIEHHISHWAYNSIARKYAVNDVVYTRDLYKYFDCPESGDTDSELACMVGAARWRGFTIDVPKLKKQKDLAIIKRGKAPTSPNGVKGYLLEVMDDTEAIVLREGTKGVILESIAKWESHRAATRAQEVLDARHADKEIELFNKLIKADRFHASFKVIGTLSSRMAGADGLNPQGIKAVTEVRACFPLANEGEILCGGDFVSFEVVISEAVYNDPKLREDLLSGKKIHALFAEELFPEYSYEEILATKGTENDLYLDGKRGIFGMTYGGTAHTLETRIGVSTEVAERAYESFAKRYPGIGVARERIKTKFCSMSQPGGIGTQVVWNEPADYIESLLGFRRYFTLENKICKALFDLAQNPPKKWKDIRIKVRRRERLQTAAGACQSALYAAAFAIQGSNMRAAANHEIQSTGSGITKEVQRAIWDLQPPGVRPWVVQPMNIHDEVMVAADPKMIPKISEVVEKTVESFKPIVPLIAIDWGEKLANWGEK